MELYVFSCLSKHLFSLEFLNKFFSSKWVLKSTYVHPLWLQSTTIRIHDRSVSKSLCIFYMLLSMFSRCLSAQFFDFNFLSGWLSIVNPNTSGLFEHIRFISQVTRNFICFSFNCTITLFHYLLSANPPCNYFAFKEISVRVWTN